MRRVFINNVADMDIQRIALLRSKDNRERIQSVVLWVYANLSHSLYLQDEKSAYKLFYCITFVTV